MNFNRREFLMGLSLAALTPGCCSLCKCARMGKVGLQLYSIRDYLNKVGLEKGLEEVAKIGYEGVEFAGYYNFKPADLRKMLANNGLGVCGTHVGNNEYGFKDIAKRTFDADTLKRTLAFNLEYGNRNVICPGGGNMPPEVPNAWGLARDGGKTTYTMNEKQADWMRNLVDLYNQAAVIAAKEGAKIGLHNHTWEFGLLMPDGQTYWDYFFSNTDRSVIMEQDVGWTTCAGQDPCAQYLKYPGRAPTLHAKENGMGPDVKKFDAILGRPGEPGAKPVEWDKLFPITDADGVEWYVVECERHADSFDAIIPSFEFLKSKGRI